MENIQKRIDSDFHIPLFDTRILPDGTCEGSTREVPVSVLTAVKVFEHRVFLPERWEIPGGREGGISTCPGAAACYLGTQEGDKSGAKSDLKA